MEMAPFVEKRQIAWILFSVVFGGCVGDDVLGLIYEFVSSFESQLL